MVLRVTVIDRLLYCMYVVQVEQAVTALQAHHMSLKGKGKSKLLDEDPAVSLIVSLKKIPNRTFRPYRM